MANGEPRTITLQTGVQLGAIVLLGGILGWALQPIFRDLGRHQDRIDRHDDRLARAETEIATLQRDIAAERSERNGAAERNAAAIVDLARRIQVMEERDEWFMRTRIDLQSEIAKLQERAEAALRICDKVAPVPVAH